MERLTKSDVFAELAIRDMIPVDMRQLSAIYHKLRLYEDTGITPDEFEIINQEYTKMARELSILRGRNRWIPVSVELPDVPIGTEDEECSEFNVMIKDACCPTTLKYAPDGAWFDDLGEVYEVVAWMPLPEPYKEGEEIE